MSYFNKLWNLFYWNEWRTLNGYADWKFARLERAWTWTRIEFAIRRSAGVWKVGLTDIRRTGKISTIQTADKPRRVKWSHVPRARITALIRDNRATLPRIKGGLLFMVTQVSVTSHSCRLARTCVPIVQHTRDTCPYYSWRYNNPIGLIDSVVSRSCTSRWSIFAENEKFYYASVYIF